jgi:hypothetical protein
MASKSLVSHDPEQLSREGWGSAEESGDRDVVRDGGEELVLSPGRGAQGEQRVHQR